MGKVLIISSNALGDTYLSASSLETLKSFDPSMEIHFIAQKDSNFLLQNLPVDKIFSLNDKTVSDIFYLIKRIRRNKYDIVFDFFPGIVNTIFFYFSKSRIKAGYPNFIKRNQWFNVSQRAIIKGTSSQRFVWQPHMNYLLRISKLLELTGIANKHVAKPIFINLAPFANHFKKDSVTIHYKATDNNRSIANDDVIKLCDGLFNKGIKKIILIGREFDFDNQIIQFCEKMNIDIIVNPPLQDLLELILEVKLFIGVDSFPLHLADAYKANFLGIFGPTFPSSVLLNSSKSLRFEYGKYLKIDTDIIIEKITSIFKKF